MSNALLTEEIDRNLMIRFNRPEIRSPLSIAVLESLSETIKSVERREDIARVIFSGVGDVFASGADLREIADLTNGEAAREFALRGQRLMNEIAGLTCETIAAVNGVCFGGALDLALSCDKRFASPDAVFSHPGANLGIMTGWGGTQRLPRLIGEAKAFEMFFTARRVDSQEALSIGLISAIDEDPLALALA